MKIYRKSMYARIVFTFLYFAPIIDNFVGATMRSTGEDSNLGKGYRFFFLAFLLLYYLGHIARNELRKFIISACAVVFLPLIYTLIHGTSAGIITDYIQLSKLFYPIIFINVLENMISRGYMDARYIYSCIKYYSWFYPLSLLIPYGLGLGYQSYKTYDAGYSGFYGAGNELSVVLVAVFIISLYDAVNNKNKFAYVPTIMNVFCILLTGTKTGMIMLFVGTIVIVLHSSNIQSKFLRGIALIVICIPIAVGVLYLMRQQMNSIVNMIRFKYDQLGRDFISFMFSNRNKKIIPNFYNSILNNQQGIINFIIGRGYYDQAVLHKTSIYVASPGLIEMDLFDIFFQHGIIITIGVVLFYLKKITSISPQKETWGMKFSAEIIILFGILAGHTFQSTLPATTLGLLIICSNYMRNEISVLRR